MPQATPLEQLLETATEKRALTLGVPASVTGNDRRFPLTPEGAATLVSMGIDVRIEKGAGHAIHYTDDRYVRNGARMVTRTEALGCDIVLHLDAIADADARRLRRGSLLLTLFAPARQDRAAMRTLLERHVVSMALDLITDRFGNTPFADILDEIEGRAAMAISASLLADSVHGKGILLGGVAGIVPCEVTVIGAGIAGIAAARSASGLGAMVRMFDSDVYKLRAAARELGPAAICSAMHPKVLVSALRSADVVIAAQMPTVFVMAPETVSEMKQGVITFNLDGYGRRASRVPMFGSMRMVDLRAASPGDNMNENGERVCYTNVAAAVPRTTAMALSNTLITMFNDIVTCGGGVVNALKLHSGMQCAVYTFMGRVVNEEIARIVGLRHVDINLLLQFS